MARHEKTLWIGTDDGHTLGLRVASPQVTSLTTPPASAVLCLHGLFSDGRFFLNSKHSGPARAFLDQGFRVFIGELRGHGQSRWPNGARLWNWSFDDYVKHDLRLLIERAATAHGGPVYLVAHSIAGYAALATLGLYPELQAKVRGVCILASAVNDYTEAPLRKRLMFNFSAALARTCGRFPARRLRLGVSDEPPALMRQFVQWARRRSFSSLDGAIDYWQLLGRVAVPVWAGVGAADRFHASVARGKQLVERLGSSDKQFVELGRRAGFSRDFGHVDVLRGEAAAREVLPLLLAWMQQRTAGRAV